MHKRIIKFLPLLILIGLFIAFYYFKLYRYLNFQTLQNHRQLWMNWRLQYRLQVTLIFITGYIIFVAVSLPNAVFLTLLGGFLFGPWLGTFYVVVSASIGGSILFLAAKTALHDFLSKKSNAWVHKFKDGFNRHKTSYLLFLRLIPIFPFWLINIIPAFFKVPLWTFVWTTFIGIIPGSLVYAFLGNSLNVILAKGEQPNLNIIFHPFIILPLIGFALLSLVPIIYKKVSNHENN